MFLSIVPVGYAHTHTRFAHAIDPAPCVIVDRVDWHARRIPMKKGSIRGFHPGRLGESAIPFESLLECNVIAALLARDEVASVLPQPFTIHFRVDDKPHRYTPDLLVQFRSVPNELAEKGFRRLTLVECKPFCKVAGFAASLVRNRSAIAEITSIPLLVITNAALTSVLPEVSDDF